MLILIGLCKLLTLSSLPEKRSNFASAWLPVDNPMLNTSIIEIDPIGILYKYSHERRLELCLLVFHCQWHTRALWSSSISKCRSFQLSGQYERESSVSLTSIIFQFPVAMAAVEQPMIMFLHLWLMITTRGTVRHAGVSSRQCGTLILIVVSMIHHLAKLYNHWVKVALNNSFSCLCLPIPFV